MVPEHAAVPAVLVVDGANVVGSRPDGWWRDRAGAAARLHQRLVAADLGADVVLVLEGRARPGVPEGDDGRVRTVHAPREGDDTVVDEAARLAAAGRATTVVTADRALAARVRAAGADVVGPGALLDRLDDPGRRAGPQHPEAPDPTQEDPVFRNPQVVLFCDDVDAAAAFYIRLGVRGGVRTPPEGTVRHADLVLDGMRLGLASHDASSEDHGVAANLEPDRAAVILWCDDVEAAHAALLEAGADDMAAPHPFLEDLRIAWARDPDGHPIQVVQRVD